MASPFPLAPLFLNVQLVITFGFLVAFKSDMAIAPPFISEIARLSPVFRSFMYAAVLPKKSQEIMSPMSQLTALRAPPVKALFRENVEY